MKTLSSLALALSTLLSAVAFGQQQPSQQQGAAPATADDDVVRITTSLVQVDALVVDKKARQVTDLRPDEFEILEDGRPQKITNFLMIIYLTQCQ